MPLIPPLHRKSNKGKAFSSDRKRDIISVMERCKIEKEISPLISTESPRKRTANYLGIGEKAVAQIYSYYLKHNNIPYDNQGNYKNHPTVVSTDIELSIRNFLRKRQVDNRYTSANDVIEYVERHFKLKVNPRNMQRTLVRMGMEWRETKKRGIIYRESADVIEKRRNYLCKLKEYRCLPDKEKHLEIWTDESYIHHHHCFNYSWYGVSDFVKRQHKGRRLVILAAGSKNGFIPQSIKTYCAQKSTGDYHGNISKEIYYKWFSENLLPNLPEKSLIIMDNASYHTALPEDSPKLNASKKEIQKHLKEHNISFGKYDLLSSLRPLLKEQVISKISPQIVELAEAKGHKILFQPPHHSDLQAIELIWANAKGKVAKQYNQKTTFSEVEERLCRAFKTIKKNDWINVIEHIHKKEEEYWTIDEIIYNKTESNEDDLDKSDDYKEIIVN
jgi:transposase